MTLLKWIFQPLYLLIIVLAVVLYINRHAVEEYYNANPRLKAAVTEGGELANLFVDKMSASLEHFTTQLEENRQRSTTAKQAAQQPAPSPAEALPVTAGLTVQSAPAAADSAVVTVTDVATTSAADIERPVEAAEPTALAEVDVPLSQNSSRTDAGSAVTVEGENRGGVAPAESSPPLPSDEGAGLVPEEAAPEVPAAPRGEEVAEGEGEVAVADESEAGDVAELQPAETAQGEGAAEEPTVASPQRFSASGESEALWYNARKAAWYGLYDEAERGYRALIRLQPENPDAYGELGNLYVATRRYRDAVNAYWQAARLLNRYGRGEAAMQVANIVYRLDPRAGSALVEELGAAQ